MDTANTSHIRKTKKSSRKKKDKPWFDEECVTLKKEISSCGRYIRTHPDNVSKREKIYELKKKLRNTVRRNKMEFQKSIINDMCGDLRKKQQKEYWNRLRKLEGRKEEQKYVPDFTLINHFKELLYDDRVTLKFNKQNKTKGALDYPISPEELQDATKILKNGKGTGIDVILNEILSPLVKLYPKLVLRAFNDILSEHGTLSQDWLHSLVSAIHKKGTKDDPDNYRGISLMSCLGKLFLTIVNNRLTTFCLSKGLISSSELGFVQGNRTSDPHIILHNLINKYCHKQKGKHLFGCFVDFSKAFDSVPRNLLIKKLQDRGIDGRILEIIKTLYLEDTASVKIGNTYSPPFKTNRGVRQGCVLSPLLFILFLSDLQETLDESIDNAKLDKDTEISCIMWADDILIFSESKEGLQQKLNSLYEYSEANELTVNTKKTKCMVFNKTGRLLKKYNFYYNNLLLENVREYKYLGFLVTPSGEIVSGLKDLRNRAMKALAKLRQTLGTFFRHNISNTIHLYTYVIRPILLYCCDFWGCLKQPKNNPIERFHTLFCKQLLGVRKQTNNDAVLQEIGLLPISIHATKIAIRNWERIQEGNANILLASSHSDACKQNLPWASNVKEIFARNGLLETYLLKIAEPELSFDKSIADILLEKLVDQYNQTAFCSFENSNRLRVFKQLKNKTGTESYLNEVHISKHRVALTKLRLSAHTLEIEVGRYNKTEPKDRLCCYCKTMGKREVEDETHFLINCPQYKELRETFLPLNVLNNSNLSDEGKMIKIMSDTKTYKSLAKFTCQAFENRKDNLEVIKSIQEMVDFTENNTAIPTSEYNISKLSNSGLKMTISKSSSIPLQKSFTIIDSSNNGMKVKLAVLKNC